MLAFSFLSHLNLTHSRYSFGVMMWELYHGTVAWTQVLEQGSSRVSDIQQWTSYNKLPFPHLLSIHLQFVKLQMAAGADKSLLARLASIQHHPNVFVYEDSMSTPSVTAAQVASFVALGQACISMDPQLRPSFDEVLLSLEAMGRELLVDTDSDIDSVF